MKEEITVFTPFDFQPDQKIHISDGPRKGDWLVTNCDDRKVTLQCPISKREFTWNRFCYQAGIEKRLWPTPASN